MSSSEVKYLNFVRWEVTGSSQDCITVCNSIWKRVRGAKISVGISILTGIISNVYVMPPTKYWTVTWPTVNCKWCIGHHALKWCKPFFIQEREDKRVGSRNVSIHECWKAITKKETWRTPFRIFNNYSTSSGWIWVGYNHLISNKREWNNCFIKTPTKYREFFPTLFVKTTDFQLVFNFEQTRTVFGECGMMAHIPWWLSQSEL